jgi:hypothetical protein
MGVFMPISGIAFSNLSRDEVVFLQSVVNRPNSGMTEAEFVNDTSIATFDGLVDLARFTIDPAASGYGQTLADVLRQFAGNVMPPTTP